MNKKNPNSQVSGLAQSSPSLCSEPTNIKNWFSSYTYQSPALDSNEDFCISPTRVNEGVYEEKGLCVEDSEGEEVVKCVNSTKIGKVHQSGSGGGVSDGYHSLVHKSAEEAMQEHCIPDAEIPTYPDSFYLPSEPPDIGNWFSSYAYESPELVTADFDISPRLNDNIGNHENVEDGNNGTSKEFTMKLKGGLLSCKELISDGCNMTVTPTGAENNKRCSAAQKHDLEGSNFYSQNNICPEMTSEQSTQGAGIGVCSITSVPCARIRDETLAPMMNPGPQTNESGHLNLMFSAKASYREAFTETCQDKTEKKSKVAENGSGWIQLSRKSEEAFCKRSKQDENQYTCTNNTPLVKRSISRTNNENSPQKSRPRKCKINSAVTREVFKETTNTQYPCAQESAGQWRCPQKNKPNPGPPLKQLRLERWVHRL